jgi:predicted RNA-binding Zn ribbon-like protein
VQAFINTHFDLVYEHGAEVLDSPEALSEWLRQAGLLPPSASLCNADLNRALAAREGLRGLAASGADRQARGHALGALDEIGAGTRVEVRFAETGPYFAPADEAGIDGALGCLLAISAQAMADGSWPRLKVCPGHHCGWAFYDTSRNRTGRWCSMSVCGGRAKAQRHYRRRRAREA